MCRDHRRKLCCLWDCSQVGRSCFQNKQARCHRDNTPVFSCCCDGEPASLGPRSRFPLGMPAGIQHQHMLSWPEALLCHQDMKDIVKSAGALTVLSAFGISRGWCFCRTQVIYKQGLWWDENQHKAQRSADGQQKHQDWLSGSHGEFIVNVVNSSGTHISFADTNGTWWSKTARVCHSVCQIKANLRAGAGLHNQEWRAATAAEMTLNINNTSEDLLVIISLLSGKAK